MKKFVEKLIARLEENIFIAELYGFGWNGQRVGNLLCLGDVKKLSEQLAEEYGKDINVTTNNGWISVNDRLPSEEQKVIACINPSIAKHEIILIPYESWNICWHDGSIIAWMPLPEPFKPIAE